MNLIETRVKTYHRIAFYFLTVLFVNSLMMGGWCKLMSYDEVIVNKCTFVKHTNTNSYAVLLHLLLENEESDNETEDDVEKEDESAKDYFFSELKTVVWHPVSENLYSRYKPIQAFSAFLEKLSPPPKV